MRMAGASVPARNCIVPKSESVPGELPGAMRAAFVSVVLPLTEPLPPRKALDPEKLWPLPMKVRLPLLTKPPV